MGEDPKGWRADCFRTRMAEFDAAYAKACASSEPQDWMDAALLAQQFRNVAYAVLTGEAPKQLHPLPFSMDERAQAAVLADLPPSVAQEAGEFYENADAGRPKGTMLKREAMAVAWRGVLRPYLIGLRDHSRAQNRPDDGYPTRPEAVKAGMAFYAKEKGVLGVEGADFHVAQRDGERWHFEAGRDPASN